MESILHKIRSLYTQMGPGEKRIADFTLRQTADVLTCSISDLARRCGVGDATLVRFSRRLGFGGFQAFKLQLAAELGSTSSLGREIERTDSCYEIFQKQLREIELTLKNTESVLDKAVMERAALALMSAPRIAVFGLGNSAAVATDMAHKLLRVGLSAQACCDNHLQAIIASHLSRGCVAVGISHSGASRDIVEALQLARAAGATTLCLTNHGDSPILAVSDMALFTKAEETSRSLLALSSRLAQLAIIDAIYAYIVVHADRAAVQAIYNTEISLQNKKYPRPDTPR